MVLSILNQKLKRTRKETDMTNVEIEENARCRALIEAPTENGMFDARKRLETFITYCLSCGLIVMLGCSFLLTDSEVEIALAELDLN
jgi:hypothetical protein